MGRKSKLKTNNNNLLLRDPEAIERDTVALSAHFLEQHLSVKSETRKWSLLQQTLFIIVLRQLKNWRKGNNNNTVVLNNENIMRELGWNFNEKNFKKIGDVLRTEFTYMVTHSGITLQDAKTKKWITENLLIGAEGDSRITRVTINPKFMNHFEDLFFIAFNFKQSFHQILEPDITSFKSKHSYLLFTDLRMRCDVNDGPVESSVQYSIEDLKILFEFEPKDYMRNRDDKTGKYSGFDYTAFEKKVFNKAIEEINETEQIKILPWEDDKFYKKIKRNRKVDSYILKFRVSDPETIRRQRLQLFEAVKKAGLDVTIYPNFKETFAIGPEWKSKWHIDKESLQSTKIVNTEIVFPEERSDKLSQKYHNMFNNNYLACLSSNSNEMRSITKNQLQDMEKARVQRIEELQKEIDRLQSEKIII